MKEDGNVTTGIQNAVLVAQSYGTSKGVSGRLMTYAEADAIRGGTSETMKNILWTRYTGGDATPNDDFRFWLGTAYNTESVWCVHFLLEENGKEFDTAMNSCPDYDVCPVLEVNS